MNLVLLGLRGSGKTTVGRCTAERAQRAFVDLDDLTPRELGFATVADAWNACGQSAFRDAERTVLERALAQDKRVIALGGGTPTAPGGADMLRTEQGAGRAVLVYLHGSPDTLRARLKGADNSHRPSLTGAGALAEIEAVYAARDPLYRALASEVVETAGKAPEELGARLAALLAESGSAGPATEL